MSKMKKTLLKMALVLLGLFLLFSALVFWNDLRSRNNIKLAKESDSTIRKNIKFAKESVFRLKFANGSYTGSGFTINSLGNMLTCAHVVDSSKDNSGKYVETLLAENYITLVVDSNKTLNDVVTFDVAVDTVIPNLDIAILTIDLDAPHFKRIKKSNASISRSIFMGFCNSDSIWEGQEVFACAYIRDQFTVPKPVIVKGTVSTIRDRVYDPRFSNEVDFVQLDMNISKGNSGAPVFLPDNGRVVGIIDWGIFGGSQWQTGYAVALSTNQIVARLRELEIPLDYR